ncbi:MAG: hypothetical protein A2Y74_07645 [Actinobacteria bacterium RBG_13_63_9]|nr:MAG: hypothetical protein A2Y74_07645 [Actinobacteria bacterium RBG_13_63_9]
MANPDIVVDIKWRRSWLAPLVKAVAWLRLRRVANGVLWLAPLEVRVGKQRPSRWRFTIDKDGALRRG